MDEIHANTRLSGSRHLAGTLQRRSGTGAVCKLVHELLTTRGVGLRPAFTSTRTIEYNGFFFAHFASIQGAIDRTAAPSNDKKAEHLGESQATDRSLQS